MERVCSDHSMRDFRSKEVFHAGRKVEASLKTKNQKKNLGLFFIV
jgi:hypothetical protein